jgi:SRSO17 transposase
LTEAIWDAEAVTSRRIALLRDEALTAPPADGVLVIDETGMRKDGSHTAHVGYQSLGTIGTIANSLVALTSRWADHLVPLTSATGCRGPACSGCQ